MKTLYFECKMGAAGDMIMSALFDLLNESQKNYFLNKVNKLFNPDIQIIADKGVKCGISGSHIHVITLGTEETSNDGQVCCSHEHSHEHEHIHEHNHEHNHEHEHSHEHGHEHEHNHEHVHSHEHMQSHHHYSYIDICDLIKTLDIDENVKELSLSIYKQIGNAEAHVHNSSLENIHFHEVGSLDALCDVVGCSIILSMLDVQKVISSPINVGNGTVRCAHGILPVPAPATAEILKGLPYYSNDINSELCTPTGAAIIKAFCSDFGNMPIMNVKQIGIGLGNKDFSIANCVRVFLGDTNDELNDKIAELSCNIDDMTGEELGFAMEILFKEGALDVFFTHIQMKKNRPGILLRCFCDLSKKEQFQKLIFKHTTTRGIRINEVSRVKLEAQFENVDTQFGPIQKKCNIGYDVKKSKFEFEDLKRIALENNISIMELKSIIQNI